MAEDKLTADIIKALLAEKYKKSGHSIFMEFRTATGYNRARYIDVVAIGLYHKNAGIKAFEIKVARADFLNDVRQFSQKHEDALEVSHEFYYVCPWKLIEKGEVPEIAGLLYVDKGNQIKTIKQAQFRKKLDIPFFHFQAFAMHFGNKIENAKIPVRWLGKDITQEDLDSELKKSRDYTFDRAVKEKAQKLLDEQNEQKDNRHKLVNELKSIVYGSDDDEKCFEKIKSCCELGQEISSSYGIESSLKRLIEETEKIQGLIENIKKEEK